MAGNIGTTSTPKTYKSWANGYKALIDTGYGYTAMGKARKDHRDGVFFVDKTSNAVDRIVEMGTTSGMSRWDDGERATQTTLKEGYDRQITQIHYGEELPIGRLAKKFQGVNVSLARRGAKGIGKDAYLLEQKAPYSIFGYGFADTNTYLTGITEATVSALGPDSKRFFSVVHPCSPTNSTTWSNALADNEEVGEEGLEALIKNLHNQLDDQGQKKHYGEDGYVWIVTLDDFAEASRVVGSELRSGSSDNDVNVYNGAFDGRPIEVKWVPWLADWSTTAHFLVAKDAVAEENLCVLTSTSFYSDDYTDEATKTAYVRGELGFAVEFVSGRGVAGSQGSGTGTYTS